MKKSSDFYLLKQKSLSEGDLFIVDYIRTKQTLVRVEKQLEIMQIKLDSFLILKKIYFFITIHLNSKTLLPEI